MYSRQGGLFAGRVARSSRQVRCGRLALKTRFCICRARISVRIEYVSKSGKLVIVARCATVSMTLLSLQCSESALVPLRRILVSSTRKPMSYINLTKRFLYEHGEVHFAALGVAISPMVTAAEILKHRRLATVTRITTSLESLPDDQRCADWNSHAPCPLIEDPKAAWYCPHAWSCCPCDQPALPYSGGGLPARERQKPKMEVIMHKSEEFDEAVAEESAAGRHQQRSEAARSSPQPVLSLDESSSMGTSKLAVLNSMHCLSWTPYGAASLQAPSTFGCSQICMQTHHCISTRLVGKCCWGVS